MIDRTPAFPTNNASQSVDGCHFEGMNLRDWFAGQALTGLLSGEGEAPDIKFVAKFAYSIADAMMAERNKKEETK